MLSYKLELNILHFDEKGYKKRVDEVIRIVIKEAMRRWLRKALKIVPSWSGMSRASLRPLGQYLHVAVPIDVVEGAPDRIAQGVAKAVTDFLKVSGGRYTFKMGTKVKHFKINDAYDATQWGFRLKNPGPYGIFETMEGDTKSYIIVELTRRLPSMVQYIKIKQTIIRR